MPRGRPKGSKNKPKIKKETNSEEYSAFEKEIILEKQKALRRKREGKPAQVVNYIKDYNEERNGPPRGKPTGICKYCKSEFEQEFVEARNTWTSYRICPDCKKKKSQKLEQKVEQEQEQKNSEHADIEKEPDSITDITLPYKPFPWQIEAEEAFWKHRFTVLACGNRSGKDRATIMIGIKYFIACINEQRLTKRPDLAPPVLWWQIAPTEKMARQNWRELKKYFPHDWIVSCSDSTFLMETIYGGIIEVRSAYDPHGLRGVGLDLATITEAALIKDLNTTIWPDVEARLNSPGRGLKGRGGKALINSSPLGLNDFYDMFQRGQKNSETYSSLWWSCRYPWTCNPENAIKANELIQTKYGPITYEESMRRQMGERTFRSNYLADFMAEDGAVFKNFEEKCVVNIYNEIQTKAHTKAERDAFIKEWQSAVPGESYVIGYDPATGSSQDTPAMVVRHRETGRIVRAYDLYGKDYRHQYDFIADISKTFNYAPIHWLRTGHTAIEGEFSNRGCEEVPLDEQGAKKAQLVQTLELAVENGDVTVLYDGSAVMQTLIDEMKDYSEENGKYSNNKTPHDDFVSAMYAAFSDYSVREVPIFYSNLIRKL